MAKFNPKKADLNNDGSLSGYEKKRGMAVAKNMSKGGFVKGFSPIVMKKQRFKGIF
jgi:hypothetical protein|tara:strand:+ start:459 stop:626 length:168 start_codon:yes stop_codon:yes gene_type:complete